MNAPQPTFEAVDPVTEAMSRILQAQREDFIADGAVSAETRIDRLERGMTSVSRHQDRLVDALNADFSCRPRELSLMTDVAAAILPMKTAMKNVRRYMKPEKRKTLFPMNLLGGRSRIEYQPLRDVDVGTRQDADGERQQEADDEDAGGAPHDDRHRIAARRRAEPRR